MKNFALLAVTLLLSLPQIHAQGLISETKEAGSFPIVSGNNTTAIYVDVRDHWLVQKAASLFQNDVAMVTGKQPTILTSVPATAKNIIIIGSLDQSPIIKKLLAAKKLNIVNKGKWEGYSIQLVSNPLKGIDKALVIAGNDRRGTAYAMFDLSEQIGVSPWHWWADVPVKKKQALYVKQGAAKYDAPSVKYRGIFINDEAPAFSGWTKEKFGGVNHKVYETIFELLLRLKANYLWPAMWGNAFNDDDTLNPIMADKYGIIMGTSHHEPMLRAQQEWKRYGKGAWNYNTNDTVLRNFWKKGIENMGKHESIVTIGMRGDGDEPMTQGTAIDLLERIVKDQRKILEEVTGKPASATPQLWALYKEVQDYYDKGMRVPDDVTLLLCDDNWGNIRKLPKVEDKKHTGGYGIYYHFDYVGGPRNYKWINTNQIERTWEQMHLAYEHGVDRIWIVNVGDLKPMELPISFFLDYAWKPESITAQQLPTYYTNWATQQFGPTHAKAIGEILARYTKYNSRRKPELLNENTYSIHNYDEVRRVTDEWNQLLIQTEKINNELPSEYKDAYFELVLHPVKAAANLQDLYTAVAYNKWFASQKWLVANKQADKAKQFYINDSLISLQYNRIANGKWNHMMDQTHIGYTYWQQPLVNKMPLVTYVLPDSAVEQANLIRGKSFTAEDLVPKTVTGNAFYKKDGYISIEAEHYTTAVTTPAIKWQIIPNLGRTSSAIEAMPVTAKSQIVSANSPHLQYDIYITDTGMVKVHTYTSPTLPFHNEGLRYAVSIDDAQPQTINMHEGYNEGIWNKWVADNIIDKVSQHRITKPGKHVLKFWLVDPAVVLQKIVVDAGGLKPAYLGPLETKVNTSSNQ